jgi:hypothetical protein
MNFDENRIEAKVTALRCPRMSFAAKNVPTNNLTRATGIVGHEDANPESSSDLQG